MAALTSDRDTPYREGKSYGDPVAASTTIFGGSLVALNATGFLVPGSTATGLIARGRACARVDNSAGADGDLACTSERGTFRWANSGDIDRTSIGATAYIVDDQTVSLDNTGKSAAGTIRDVDALGVWVET